MTRAFSHPIDGNKLTRTKGLIKPYWFGSVKLVTLVSFLNVATLFKVPHHQQTGQDHAYGIVARDDPHA